MVAFDRSGEGGELRIVTDPNEIRNIEIEEQERKRNVSEFINKQYSIRFIVLLLYKYIKQITWLIFINH